jgi:predicted nucleotidyltransferase
MVEMRFKAREGDLIETRNHAFFDVKGLVHPPRKVVAFIRFFSNPKGDRKRENITYRKVYPLKERYELLRERFPRFLVFDPVFDEQLCEVPLETVKHHFEPPEGLTSLRNKDALDDVETDALELAGLLKKNASVSWSYLGISGSILVGLHTSRSDIDPVIYGSENCRNVHSTLKSLMKQKDSPVKPYAHEGLKRLFDFRSKDTIMPFEDFLRTESRKVLQGMFKRRDYFIRCVKDWSEIDEQYGMVQYKSMGYAKIKAIVTDDSEMIFTPCSYKIAGVKILEGVHIDSLEEIVSFRGRFCEQARNGETVIAQGKVERVQTGEQVLHRLLLGNRISDFMVSLEA